MPTSRKLTQQAEELQIHFDRLHEKITRLRKALAIEVDPTTKFKYENQLADAEAEREQVEQELQRLEQLEQQPEMPEDLSDVPKPQRRAFPLRYALIGLIVIAIAGLVWRLSTFETKPFPMTVFLRNSTGPIPANGQVILTLGGATQEAQIGQNGDAYFRQIPANFRNQAVPVAIKAEGFELAQPDAKYPLTGERIEVEIKRAASLSKIFGTVQDASGGFLEGAEVRIGDWHVKTDHNGNFRIELPVTQQQERYPFVISKEGYVSWEDVALPGSKIEVILNTR